jgi:chemotaxis protein MotB
LKTLPNNLLIEGHTDATPYSEGGNYSNWELSADRANSARRLLQQDGVRSDQVTQVRGYADQLLRVKNNPTDPSNRRISILVKNQEGPMPDLKGASVVGGPIATPQPKTPGSPEAAPVKTQSPSPAPVGASQVGTKNTSAPASVPSPPTAAKPTASKPGLMTTIKGMLPGSKKYGINK